MTIFMEFVWWCNGSRCWLLLSGVRFCFCFVALGSCDNEVANVGPSE